MTSGELERPDAVVVQRTVDADVEGITEELTNFAVSYGLQLDRRYDGDGMKFIRKKGTEVEEQKLFRSGDELLVVLSPRGERTDITLTATMAGLHQRGNDWKRGRAIRGGLLSAMFVWLGAKGLAHPDVGDAVLIGLGAMFGMRTFRAVSGEGDDRAAFEDDVHDALVALVRRMDD